jgi:glycosyltransferase involved in cell wall biosynthesis
VVAPPLISIVIPCYNQGHYLREALDSVRAATMRTVEVIVVDDGSTDETRTVAASTPGTTCVRQANAGLAAARNRGLEEARGDYVVFLDADDRFAAGGLDVAAAALDAHPECAFVYGRCLMMAADGSPMPTPEQPRVERHHYRELLRRNVIWMPAMAMVRREAVVRAGGFDPTVNASADYRLYLRLARTSPVYDHARVVAHYRQHGANMSRNAARMLRESLTVLAAEWPFARGNPDLEAAYREGWRTWQDYYGTHMVNDIRAHVHGREWAEAMRKAVTLGRLHPRGLVHHALRKLSLVVGSGGDGGSGRGGDGDSREELTTEERR